LLNRSDKLVIEEEKCNLMLQVTRMVLDARGWKAKHKLKITWISVSNVKCHGLSHIIFVLNGHMPINGEHAVFRLAHTSWWVNEI
jgi:hypothetical protein